MLHSFRAIAVGGLLATLPFAVGATTVPTGVTGGNAPFSQYQPGLVLSQLLATGGVYPPREGGGGEEYLAEIRSFAGNYGAFGAPQAQGQLSSIAQNTALFSILGNQYGGNGVTNFALPNLVGTTIVGQGQGPGLSPYFVGQQGGAATTTLTEANLPPHDHTAGGGVTSVVGSATPFSNLEPSLALTSMIAVEGVFPGRDGGVEHAFLGEVSQFAGNYTPGGFLAAEGQVLPIDQYVALFSVIGTTYGGDGVSTFALPDLRGRTIVGAGQGPGLASVSLGESLGTEATVLTLATLAAHDHTLPGGGVTGSTGGGQPFDTHQPSLGLNYLIALYGIYPSGDGGGGLPEQTPFVGEVQAFAGNYAPGGWALAEGQLLNINQYQALFSILGTQYGGDGRQTFALPDLRGRSILGAGNGFSVGEQIGSDTTTLTVANLAAHVHEVDVASVPEPESWTLMLAGVGLAGAALRRRQQAQTV